MKMKSFIPAFCLSAVSFVLVEGCSSSPKYVKTEVIENSTRDNKTPDWVKDSQVLLQDGSDLVFVYKMNLDGSVRPDACLSMAKTQAVAEMMKYIKNAVTASGQVEELNASSDPSMSSLVAFLSQGNISGARVTSTYWEQTMSPDDSGVRPVKKLQCDVKVNIEKSVLDRQMKEAITGAPGGNPEIRQKLLDAQKNFIDGVSN